MEKKIVDTAMWVTLTTVASLGAAAGQDWSSAHGRIVGVAAVLAVVGAAFKTFPTFTA